MWFTVRRLSSSQRWLIGGGAATGALLFGGYSTAAALRDQRRAACGFDGSAVVASEESARYPCEVLRGFDVVVQSYYMKRAASTRADEAAAAGLLPSSSSYGGFFPRLQRWMDLFSNERHRVSCDAPDSSGRSRHGDCGRTPGQQGESQFVRFIVGDARGDESSPLRDAVGAVGGGKQQSSRAIVASGTWPPHTEKYSALILEPSTAAPCRDSSAVGPANSSFTGPMADADVASTAEVGSQHRASFLRCLTDGATHQSLIRCNPRSTMLDMTCDGDPTYLGAAYLRTMLTALLLLPSAASTVASLHVAVLGVGGGSLPVFLQRYFSSWIYQMELVDVEPSCFRAAVEQLGMRELLPHATAASSSPPSSAAMVDDCSGGGIRYYVEDAASYLGRRGAALMSSSHSFQENGTGRGSPLHASPAVFNGQRVVTQRRLDLLFVDLFVGSEADGAVTSLPFLESCRSALSPYGVVAFNLPAADQTMVRRCQAVFGGPQNVFAISVPSTSNVVLIARGGPGWQSGSGVFPDVSHRHLYRRAKQLTQQYQLPFDLAAQYPIWWRLW